MAVTQEEHLQELSKGYRFGWHDPEHYVFQPKKGLSEEVVEEISYLKSEPDWMRKYRLKALKHFRGRPMPTFRGGPMPGFRGGFTPGFGFTPRFDPRSNGGMFEPRFDPRFNGGMFDPRFDPRFNGGMITPRFPEGMFAPR